MYHRKSYDEENHCVLIKQEEGIDNWITPTMYLPLKIG